MRYAPPDATFTADNQLQLFKSEMEQKQYRPAAARLDSLLRDSADTLMGQGEDASVLSISAWVDDLPVETKNLLRPALEASVGAAAQQAIEEARTKPDADPAAFYALARRYPLTQAASAALAEAARRSALLGDVPSARWMLDSAIAGGWVPDPSLKDQIDRSIARPHFPAGPLPFDASWYGIKTRQAWAALRSFPVTGDEKIFVVGPGQVVAMTKNGDVLWRGPAGTALSPARGTAASIGVTRGPPFSAAMLCDLTGVPQVLVVRQPQSHTEGWALRALRASDGRLLWSTEGQDDYQGLVFGSNPLIVGRYVYAIAGELGDQLDHLWFVAIEVTTGQLLWRCDLGSQSRTIQPQPGARMHTDAFRPWLNESAPAVAGDLVIAAPNVGAVVAVGRFDGKLRWTHGYATLPDPTSQLQQQRRFAIEHPSSTPPLATGLSLRWAGTPAADAEMVVAAPQDSDQVFALGLRDGKTIWQSPDLQDSTLVGVADGVAVMAGTTLTGLTTSSGKVGWSDADHVVTGPCFLCDSGAAGSDLLVPTAAGVVSLSAATGSVSEPAQKTPVFESALLSDAARGALRANDVMHCFGMATTRRDFGK